MGKGVRIEGTRIWVSSGSVRGMGRGGGRGTEDLQGYKGRVKNVVWLAR